MSDRDVGTRAPVTHSPAAAYADRDWNSNAIVAWIIARSGLNAESIQPPAGGRAPGWHAGLQVAASRTAHAGEARRTA